MTITMQHRVVLKRVKDVMELFGKENALFNPKLFVSIIGERAFPGDTLRQAQLVSELLTADFDASEQNVARFRN